MECAATGSPAPIVTWKVKGHTIGMKSQGWDKATGYEVTEMYINHTIKGFRNATQNLIQNTQAYGTNLLITEPTQDVEGPFLCRAVQKLYDSSGKILLTDFKELVINVRAESESLEY